MTEPKTISFMDMPSNITGKSSKLIIIDEFTDPAIIDYSTIEERLLIGMDFGLDDSTFAWGKIINHKPNCNIDYKISPIEHNHKPKFGLSLTNRQKAHKKRAINKANRKRARK